MAKYLFKRIVTGLLSVIAVVALVMVLIYALGNRELIFRQDPLFIKQSNNVKQTYKFQKWEEYGYLDYVTYADFLNDLVKAGELDEEAKASIAIIGRTAADDSEKIAEYVKQFTETYEARGYTVQRLDAVLSGGRKVANGGQQQLFAYKDRPLINRMIEYFTGIFEIDNIHYAESVQKNAIGEVTDIGEPGLTFTLYDPMYGGEKFSPAVLGNGTRHKYLFYCTDSFPFIHQNILTLRLGTSSVVNQGVDVFDTMIMTQGSFAASTITYPTGLRENSADDLHTAVYVPGSLGTSGVYAARYTDDYTNVRTVKNSMSKVGFSFSIGILSVIMAYILGIPIGILMSRKKDKLVDKIGTIYIVFIIAVPSLAYIFLFKAVGGKLGLPTTFDMESSSRLMYVLPIISLALPSVANLMKWMRRYMIDQMNSDYVKFARSEGLSEKEIFTKHIWKNAVIPIVHGIPGSILGCLTGAIITERVYVVPGAGNLLTQAINAYDNSVIVGVTLFYAVLSVVSIILGDVLMSMVDPRISFTSKAR